MLLRQAGLLFTGLYMGLKTWQQHPLPGPIQLYYPKTPSIRIVPTLRSKVYTWYLLWAIWSLRGITIR